MIMSNIMFFSLYKFKEPKAYNYPESSRHFFSISFNNENFPAGVPYLHTTKTRVWLL